jgi:phosphatidate cytidylyltransferase
MTMLVRRVLSAAVLIPVVVWVVAGAPSWVFRVLVVGLSAMAAWELARLFEQAGRAVRPRLGAVCAALVAASFGMAGWPAPGVPGLPVVAALAASTVAILGVPVWAAEGPSSDATLVGLSGVCYVGVLMGHALLVFDLPHGRGLLLFLLAVTWAGETAAYLVGSALGRHKLAPRISPGKTIEGGMAQLLVSGAAAWALGGLLPGWSGAQVVMAGLMLGSVGQVGDLAESAIKRSVGAKDAGGAIPGHGGLLDRIDGLLFNTPALFYYAGVLGGRA